MKARWAFRAEPGPNPQARRCRRRRRMRSSPAYPLPPCRQIAVDVEYPIAASVAAASTPPWALCMRTAASLSVIHRQKPSPLGKVSPQATDEVVSHIPASPTAPDCRCNRDTPHRCLRSGGNLPPQTLHIRTASRQIAISRAYAPSTPPGRRILCTAQSPLILTAPTKRCIIPS